MIHLILPAFVFWVGCTRSATPVPPPLVQTQKTIGQPSHDLQQIISSFVKEYGDLRIPEIDLEYVKNFQKISKKSELERRIAAAQRYQAQLNEIKAAPDDFESQLQVEWLRTILVSMIDRSELEMKFTDSKLKRIPTNGLYSFPNREQWYAFYAKRYASFSASPDEIEKLGLSEVERIRGEISKIQARLGFAGNNLKFQEHLESSEVYYHQLDEVMGRFTQTKIQVASKLKNQFSESDLGNLQIAPVKDADRDTPPGLYMRDKKTFYFSFFQNRFKKRFAEWLFLHEAIPGHHYQYLIQDKSKLRPKFGKFSIHLSGFSEGWGTYVENLGSDLGLYNDPYSLLGKMEWDLVRSARLVIDVGIHVRGWSRAQAVEFWKKNISGQDDIMDREIDRIIRWPVQVISYKMGESQFLSLKNTSQECLRAKFDPKRFHKAVLQRGTMPFSILKMVIEQDCKRS